MLKGLYCQTLLVGIIAFVPGFLWGYGSVIFVYLISILFFTMLTIYFLHQSYNTLRYGKDHSFMGLVVFGFLLKLVFSIALLFGYQKIVNPDNKYFAIHFLAIYLLYLIWDLYLLNKVPKLISSKKKEDH